MNSQHSSRTHPIIRAASVLLLILMSFAVSMPAQAFPIVHVVTFSENSSANDSVTSSQTSNAAQQLTSVQDMIPSFSNIGYTFEGWNTSADGSGIAYADGAIYPFTSDVTLYAQWLAIPIVHVVTFFENANPTDSAVALEADSAPQTLTLLQDMNPSFSHVGYAFEGWNTLANGGGTAYADGSTFSFDSDLSLYAQWAIISVVHDVTFFENDNATDSESSVLSGSSPTQLTTFVDLQPAFSNSGHLFSGWNTSADGSGTSYQDGAQYSFATDLTLYAQWSPLAIVHTVTFNENDNVTDFVNVIMSDSAPSAFTLFANLNPIFQNGSLTFSGWNTSRDGTGTPYSDGTQYSFASNLVLYAQWIELDVETISFSANGGSGSVSPISEAIGSTISIPAQTGLIRIGFVFIDWNSKANGSGSKYVIGEKVLIPESTVLYAQWSGHKLATLFGAVGTFKSGSSSLSASLKSQVNRIALTIKSRKYVKIDLFGYSATTGLKSLNISLSRDRARNVATYLINRLRDLKVHGVSISSSGQGSIAGQSSREYSRVEVFGV
jgi:uncharacterized repeat protein (TIGR02543 family)